MAKSKRGKQVKRRSFEAMALRVHKPKVIQDKREKLLLKQIRRTRDQNHD